MNKTCLLALIVCMLFAGCKIMPPKVSGARAFSLTEDPNGNRAIRVEIRIDNPNAIGFRVNDPMFEVFLNSKKIGTAYSGAKLRVKARSNDYYGVYLGTDIKSWGDALGPLLSILTTGKIQFEVKGDLTARFLFWKRSLDVNISENVGLTDLLKK